MVADYLPVRSVMSRSVPVCNALCLSLTHTHTVGDILPTLHRHTPYPGAYTVTVRPNKTLGSNTNQIQPPWQFPIVFVRVFFMIFSSSCCSTVGLRTRTTTPNHALNYINKFILSIITSKGALLWAMKCSASLCSMGLFFLNSTIVTADWNRSLGQISKLTVIVKPPRPTPRYRQMTPWAKCDILGNFWWAVFAAFDEYTETRCMSTT